MESAAELRRLLSNVIRLGNVAEVDLARAHCRVQSGELITDFVPWLAPRAGSTIEWSAPTVGEQVLLLSPGGDTHGAVALRGLYSNAFSAPDNNDARHILRYADGATIAYDAEAHALTATLPAGATATITADSGVTINGPLTINGNTQINGDAGVSGTAIAEIDVIGAGKSLKGHKHLGVTAGSATSGPPQ